VVVKACFDSDVLIDYFDGVDRAAEELSRYQSVLVSRITWMEVLVGAPTSEVAAVREEFLSHIDVVELDEAVAREAIAIRKQHRLRLPDAIIWASARVNHALLVTRNSKDFPRKDPGIRIPYLL